MQRSDPQPLHSLAATQTGDVVEIRRILSDTLRTHCSELDIAEGDILRCRAGTPSQVLLETRHGRTVSIQRDWARFIQVTNPVVAA